MKKIKSLTGSALLMVFGILGFVSTTSAVVQMPAVPKNMYEGTIPTLLNNIINWGAGIAALVSILVILIAGIIWATSGGSEDGTKKARSMLLMGIVGLIIALAAWAVVNVVLKAFFQGTTTGV